MLKVKTALAAEVTVVGSIEDEADNAALMLHHLASREIAFFTRIDILKMLFSNSGKRIQSALFNLQDKHDNTHS